MTVPDPNVVTITMIRKMSEEDARVMLAADRTSRMLEMLPTILRESGLPAELIAMIEVALPAMDPEMIAAILTDAMMAKTKSDEGDPSAARALVERHRQTAEDLGLGGVLDEMFRETELPICDQGISETDC